MLGISHDRLISAPARAARRRSAATLTSRFSIAARTDQIGEDRDRWKLSHHATSGPVSDCGAAAYWLGTSTVDSSVGVAHPARTHSHATRSA